MQIIDRVGDQISSKQRTKTKMKDIHVTELTDKELQDRLNELNKELFRANAFRNNKHYQMIPKNIKQLKKETARILTEINQNR